MGVENAGRGRRGWALALLLAVLMCAVGSRRDLAAEGLEPAGGSAANDAFFQMGPAAALRVARAALEAGDGEQAVRLLAHVSERHSVIGDHVDLMRARLLRDGGELAEVERLVGVALDAYPDSTLRSDLYQLLGDVRAERGDEPAARSAWRAALEATSRSDRRAEILLALAESLERSGRIEEAAATYTDLWITQPTSPQEAVASRRLDSLAVSLGRPPRSASDWRRHADTLFRRRRNERALEAYDRALELGLTSSQTRRARQQRAHTLFRMRRYPEAVEAFASLPQEKSVRLWHARSLARAGDVPRSVRELEKLANETRGELGVRARYLAALLLDGRDFEAEARSHYERVAASRATPSLARAALWRLGWSAFRAERWDEALGFFDRLDSQRGDPIAALRPRYWAARALEARGDTDAARQRFAEIASEFPFSYYGWRSRPRAAGSAAVARESAEIRSGTDSLPPRLLARPRILLEAGLRDEAIAELGRVRSKARGLSDRLQLAELFSEAAAYHDAQRIVVDAYRETLARGPVARLEELWWHAWPAAYQDMVGASVEVAGVTPALVFSIMREESGYRPAVVSPAGARGLLQIMTETGERLARGAGRNGFHADDLFDPETNIDLGARYLGDLSRRFKGRQSASIASYNAGPVVVARWVESEGHREDDEWVEAIPYDQTRTYVKRVLRSLHVYEVLY